MPTPRPVWKIRCQRLLADHVNEVVLDLSQTGFLDSSGLRAILTAQRRLTDERGRLAFRGPSEAVTRLLEITGLTRPLRSRIVRPERRGA